MRRLLVPGALIAIAGLVGCAQLAAAPSSSPVASVDASTTPSPSPTPDAASARLSALIAADDCDFTVPGAQRSCSSTPGGCSAVIS